MTPLIGANLALFSNWLLLGGATSAVCTLSPIVIVVRLRCVELGAAPVMQHIVKWMDVSPCL